MKNSLFDKWLLILVLAFTAYQSKAQVIITEVDSQSLYSYQWTVFWMQDVNLYSVDWSKFPNLLFYPGDPGRVVGSSGCHEIECDYTSSEKGNIRFSNLSIDHYECETEVDSRFLKVLGKTKRYKIQHHELRLYGEDGELLARFYPEFTHSAFYTVAALDGEWQLDYLRANKTNINLDRTFPDCVPTITFSKSHPETIAGFTGCNTFSSLFTIRPSYFGFNQVNTLETNNCKTDGEEIFLKTLHLVTNYTVSDNILDFLIGNGVVMTFKRKSSALLEKGGSVRFREKKIKRTIYGCGND